MEDPVYLKQWIKSRVCLLTVLCAFLNTWMQIIMYQHLNLKLNAHFTFACKITFAVYL